MSRLLCRYTSSMCQHLAKGLYSMWITRWGHVLHLLTSPALTKQQLRLASVGVALTEQQRKQQRGLGSKRCFRDRQVSHSLPHTGPLQVRAEQFRFFAEALKSAKLKVYVPYFVQEAQASPSCYACRMSSSDSVKRHNISAQHMHSLLRECRGA